MVTDFEIRERLNSLAKPRAGFGKLETLAFELCRIQQTLQPVTIPRRLVLFAADHGVATEGISAWPQGHTRRLLNAALAGNAACSILANSTSTELHTVDVGVLGVSSETNPTHRARLVRSGSRNLSVEPAMTVEEFRGALEIGRNHADEAYRDQIRIVAVGEIGVGNSTVASCLTALLTGEPVESVVGPGAGVDNATLERKRKIVQLAVARSRSLMHTNLESAIADVAGLEVVAMAGFFQRAAERKMTVVLDGFISTAAALVADKLSPGSARYLIAAHRSTEPGHTVALAYLNLIPILEWEMRVGEGTGALLLMPLLDAAAAIITHMTTFEDAKPGD
jgi:nicotinate-nucleotide--dimethylbenzimidazole phosphoribosyltransferase